MIINLENNLLILFSFIIFQLNKIIRNLKVNKLEAHQKYTSSINGNLIGGYSIFFFILIFQFYQNYTELLFLSIIFVLGVLSDNKIFNSPKYRLIFQIIFIFLFISISDLRIIDTRVETLNYLISNDTLNIIFTTFCVLIVLNGSNFIDGLNGLVIGYFIIVIFFLLNLDIDLNYFHNTEDVYQNFLVILCYLLILNFFNLIFLGDGGAYLIGFILSITLIKISNYPDVSLYFIILLLYNYYLKIYFL